VTIRKGLDEEEEAVAATCCELRRQHGFSSFSTRALLEPLVVGASARKLGVWPRTVLISHGRGPGLS